ncbi:3189_t:CDS:2, partial [Racocetra persica]
DKDFEEYLVTSAVTLHNAGLFLRWFYDQRRNRLNITTLEDMAKVHSYYISNANTELTQTTLGLELDELRKKVLDATVSMD